MRKRKNETKGEETKGKKGTCIHFQCREGGEILLQLWCCLVPFYRLNVSYSVDGIVEEMRM